jgi:ribA/ribD-fused uncharacterized protein
LDEKRIMINEFREEYRWLSNFYPCDIELDGIKFKSVENAYMSAKSDNPEWKEYCRTELAKDVKEKSKEIELIENWDEIKVKVMKKCLIQKFNQFPLKQKLLATENQNIVEGTMWHDTFWGVDLKVDPNYGENMLGRLIMSIRSKLKK